MLISSRLLIGLLFASTAVGATTKPAAPTPRKSMVRLPARADRVVIPLETAGRLLIIKVDVDGHEGQFIVDTAATYTMVDQGTADRWKLNPASSAPPNGNDSPLRIFRIDRLMCGEVAFTPIVITGADLRQLSSVLQFQVAGILGSDLLGAAPFEIDYRKQTLTVYDSTTFAPPSPATVIPLRVVIGIPNVEISVEGYRVDAAVDTGNAGAGTLNPIPLLDHPELLDGKPRLGIAVMRLNGIHNDFNCRFNPVSLLGHDPHAVWFSCSSDYTGNDNVQTNGNTIGGEELTDGCFTFDYASRRLWAKWPPKETQREMLARLGDARGHDLAGLTPLMRAAQAGREDVMAVLLQRGADANATDAVGRTPLMSAMQGGNRAAMRMLLDHGARLDITTSVGGETALHYACERLDADMVKQLLGAGADPNAADTRGYTPLTRAVEGDQLGMANALLAAGADPLAADKEGYTPLILAARRASPALLKAILDKLGSRAAASAGVAMGMAAYDGRVESVKLLLDVGADPNAADKNGSTPLIEAVQDDSGEVARLLLTRGADPSLRSREGKTAWDYAVSNNRLGVLRALMNPPASNPHR